jgi:hypothetical protein
MTPIQIQKSSRFTLWPLGYELTTRLSTPLDNIQVPPLADLVLRSFQRLLTSQELTNLKGRDEGLALGAPGPLLGTPRRDELLAVGGYFPRRSVGGKVTPLPEGDPFTVLVTTPFERFEGNNQIVHRVLSSGELPGSLSVHELGRAFPLELTELRLGIDRFHSVYISGALGFAPTVRQSLRLDLTSTTLEFELVESGAKDRSDTTLPRLSPFREFLIGLGGLLDVTIVDG